MTPTDFTAWLANPVRPPLIMGVLNVTPDSFSDGGRYADPRAAVDHARAMLADGADLLDVGGESTRPGSARTPAEEQIRRIVPVIELLHQEIGDRCILSIDTTRSPVAQAALDAGAHLINDISAGTDDPQMFPLAAARRVPIILMHMQGQPATMQENPVYRNVVEDVSAHLSARQAAAVAAGIDEHHILLDPGIGFGKRITHNLELLRRLGELTALGRPLVLGTSRKGFLGQIAGETDPRDRLFSTAASVAWCAANGAAILRVHDVAAMAKVVRVIRAIREPAPDERASS